MPTPFVAAIDRDSIPVRVVDNPDYEQGQLSSLLTGFDARSIGQGVRTGALVTLIDVPLVAPDTVRTLLQ